MSLRKSARNTHSPQHTPSLKLQSKGDSKGVNSPTTVCLLERLEAKLEASIENIIMKIKESEERVMEKIGEISAEITNLKSAMKAVDVRVSALESLRYESNDQNKEVITLCQQVDELENALVATDVIIYGVPLIAEENLTSLFSKLCTSINLTPLPARSTFRLRKNNSNKKPSPIIVKLNSSYDRSLLFKAIAGFFKANRTSLTLRDIGLNGDEKIYVHECLTNKNRELIQIATRLKRQKLLASAFSIRGQIYVRKHLNSEATKVLDCESVERIAAAS
ncbi:uncharacterized protein LOC118756261 [Rhagoletis pomonella]|uniref:uncharacterized protein LOC118756261 n=1 Tax=Rhagoletis pomonella TaxID=28610 RepID=UPI0017864B70|nr:uncharacterized protein LOC118756261 [Rhagoletis pomonella]